MITRIINIGSGNDLVLTHNGSNSFIKDSSGTGNLKIQTNQLDVENADGNETIATFTENVGVTLRHTMILPSLRLLVSV